MHTKISFALKAYKKDDATVNDAEMLLSLIISKPECYEILENQRVPYFDFDFYYSSENERADNFDNDISKVINEISKCYDLNKQGARVYWAISNGIDLNKQKEKKPYFKNSIHIILRGYGYYIDPKNIPKPIKTDDTYYDVNVYHKYQKFRAIYSSKKGHNRPKKPYDYLTKKSYDISEHDEAKESIYNYLISNVEGEILMDPPNEAIMPLIKVKSKSKSKKIIESKDESKEDSKNESKDESNDEINNDPLFTKSKHFKLLISCLNVDRNNNMKDWLDVMGICKNIIFEICNNDPELKDYEKEICMEIIHKYMKKGNKYDAVEIDNYMNKPNNFDGVLKSWGSLVSYSKTDNLEKFNKIVSKLNNKKNKKIEINNDDIFNIERLDEMRNEPKKYVWSDYSKFHKTKITDPSDLLKYMIDTSNYINNTGKPYYVLYDKKFKQFNKYTKLPEYENVVNNIKNNPFKEAAKKCCFTLNGNDSNIYLFSLDYFKSFYYNNCDMVPYGGDIDPTKSLIGVSRFLNKFDGLDIAKSEVNSENCDILLYHIKNIIASGDIGVFDYLIKCMANAIQHPENKPEVYMLLKGAQGCGKNRFVDICKALIGLEYTFETGNLDDILGGFNASLSNKLLVIGNEIVNYASHKNGDKLKNFTTAEYFLITLKGVDGISERSYHWLILTTNNDRTLHICENERRLFAIHVSSLKVNNTKYFNELSEAIANKGAIKGLYNYLMTIDLSNWKARDVPNTDLKKSMVEDSLDQVVHWFIDYCMDTKFIIKNECIKINFKEAFKLYSEYVGKYEKGLKQSDFKKKIIDKLNGTVKHVMDGLNIFFNVKDTNILCKKLISTIDGDLIKINKKPVKPNNLYTLNNGLNNGLNNDFNNDLDALDSDLD